MTAQGVFSARWTVVGAVFLPFFFLHEVDECEHDGFFILVFIFCSRARPVLVRYTHYLLLTLCTSAARAAFRHSCSSGCCLCDDFSNILAASHGSPSQLLAGASCDSLSRFRCSTCSALGFMYGNAATTQLAAFGEKAFACVAFSDEVFVLFAQLIPKIVEVLIMWAVDYVGESMEQIQ